MYQWLQICWWWWLFSPWQIKTVKHKHLKWNKKKKRYESNGINSTLDTNSNKSNHFLGNFSFENDSPKIVWLISVYGCLTADPFFLRELNYMIDSMWMFDEKKKKWKFVLTSKMTRVSTIEIIKTWNTNFNRNKSKLITNLNYIEIRRFYQTVKTHTFTI